MKHVSTYVSLVEPVQEKTYIILEAKGMEMQAFQYIPECRSAAFYLLLPFAGLVLAAKVGLRIAE